MEALTKCKVCHVEKIRRKADYHFPRYNYRDERGRLWKGLMCPSCTREANKKFDKPHKPKIQLTCIICQTQFMGHTKRVCSQLCRRKRNSQLVAKSKKKSSTPTSET